MRSNRSSGGGDAGEERPKVRTWPRRAPFLASLCAMDQSREWLEHMLDTQGTGTGLTASASVTAYQQPDLTLSHKKCSPSIDPRKTPTPASQESKRSSSQPKEGEPPSVAAPTEKPSPNPNGASLGKPSQGRSQSSGVAPSWKTPSVSSIPTQLSEDPAELAAINSGINKMVTALKVAPIRSLFSDARRESKRAWMRRRWRQQTRA